MKYYKTEDGRLYYRVSNDKSWWYWDNVRWIPSLTLWKPREYNPFIVKASQLEVLIVLGPEAVE